MQYLIVALILLWLFPAPMLAIILMVVLFFKVVGLFTNPTKTTMGSGGGAKWGNN